MKKGKAVFLKVLAILLLIGGAECLLAALFIPGGPGKAEPVGEICVADIEERTVLYFQEIEILERYAFQTVEEYRDGEGTYTDTDFYVYDASRPMDGRELHSEYYIVRFRDGSGGEYLASLCVSAGKADLSHTPLRISLCAAAIPVSDSTALMNDNQLRLRELRTAALESSSRRTGLPPAGITLDYEAESMEQFLSASRKDTVGMKLTLGCVGVVLILLGIRLLRRTRKKKSAP